MKKGIIVFILIMLLNSLLVGCAGQAADESADVPITAEWIVDGTYAIEVSSSSSMFRIVDAQLTVEGDAMDVVMTMSGTGYDKIYMGTGEQALLDTDDNSIYPVENVDGAHTYTVEVGALNQEVDCTALSTRKQTWYDRILVFKSSMIPQEAIIRQPDDGEYRIDVVLTGGAGKAAVESPARLTVKDGEMTAEIAWSSPNYDLMIVDGESYYPTNKDGNSTFTIPVSRLGKPISLSAETTAMSQPYLIDYTLVFDAASVNKEGQMIWLAAGILIAILAGFGTYQWIWRSKKK